MDYIKAFFVGGFICLLGQIVIDKTKITPGRLVVILVITGAILGALGIYKPIIEFAGAGATVPITGFGYSLIEGVRKSIDTDGFSGIFKGGLTATASGISAVVFFSFIVSVLANPKQK